MPAVTVVIATRDRRPGLLRTLGELRALPERPPVVVVDNGSADGSPDAVEAAYPEVTVLRLGRNLGSVARNVGVARAGTPYVAFADDDSWWAPGALTLAAAAFDRYPRLGVLAARVLVGPRQRPDPLNAVLAASPLGQPDDLPGPPVLGFLACGAVVRRAAFLAAGGFDEVLFFFGEESLLAWDVTAAGWACAYLDTVVAHHHPAAAGAGSARARLQRRNALLTDWMRRPLPVVAARTAAAARAAVRDPVARGALRDAVGRGGAAWRRRRLLPARVESAIRLVEAGRPQAAG
jgi:GT2 family glycosyltransferase